MILDCTDNLETRFLINDFSLKHKIPFIYAAALEEKGYVYFVNTGFDAGLTPGPFTVSFGAIPDKIDSAIDETLSEIKKLVEKGIREDELRDAVRYITGAYPLNLETPAGLARALLNAEYYGLGMDYPWAFKKYYEGKAIPLFLITKSG